MIYVLLSGKVFKCVQFRTHTDFKYERRENMKKSINIKKTFGITVLSGLLLTALVVTGCGGSAEDTSGLESGNGSAKSAESADASADVRISDASGDTAGDTGNAREETADAAYDLTKGIVYTTTVIPDVQSISSEKQSWGNGPDRDELNRPVSALTFNEKYADYNVDFIEETEEKVVFLTFDEGYENGYTDEILDTLNEKGWSGIFFCTMDYVTKNPELVQRMIDEGHIVGNHTVHHPADGMDSLSVSEQQEEVMGLHEYVKENFDYDMFLFRYPSGEFSEQSLAVINNCGYKSVFWSFAYVDWLTDEQPDESESLTKLTDSLHPGAIYLLHAVSSTNAHILGQFIDNATAQGYTSGDYGQIVLDEINLRKR